MLVTRENFPEVLARLSVPGWYGFDTETTGLAPYKGDRIFSIIIAQGEESWYFNFNPYKDSPLNTWLLDEHKEAMQGVLFSSREHCWYIHNAKYDMHMLGVEDMALLGFIFCTYGQARLLHNDLFRYNLEYLCERWLGEKKSDLVKEYANEHGLFTEYMKGKQKRKNYQFWNVPLHVVQEYAEKDGILAWKLGEFIRAGIKLYDDKFKLERAPPLQQVSDNEAKLTKVLYEMEKVGVQLNREYAEKALNAESSVYREAARKFEELAGMPFEDKAGVISMAFKRAGVELPKGGAGRSLTNKGVLESIDHPISHAIRDYRKSYKKAVTYYANFLAMSDEHGVIHADFHQGGTKTGRLSCRDPNLQNLNRPDEDADPEDAALFEVRRCFVPRPGFVFFAPDYDQIEYRLMLEYAGEQSIIDLVNDGMDVHSATGERLSTTRYQAKTINFMLIYGGGIEKLAEKLKCSWAEAKDKRTQYFDKLPRIAAFINGVRANAAFRLSIYNWFGRRYRFADADSVYTTAPNWLIQGGCAEVLKIALIECATWLLVNRFRSRIVLNVHDEIVFEMPKEEFHIAPELTGIMENVYKGKLLKLTAGPAYSYLSLADKLDGYPR